jgi:hypothetical protein
MIADKLKFYVGLGMLASFAVVLGVMFSPVFNGDNALAYFDDLYNSISKGSAYYIDDEREKASEYVGTNIDVTVEMNNEAQAGQTVALFLEVGAHAAAHGAEVEVTGDLGDILLSALDDADAVYNNDEEVVRTRYGVDDGLRVMYNWHTSLDEMVRPLQDQRLNDEARAVSSTVERAVEPAYNYFGIEPEHIGDRIGVVLFSLVFYVLYTVWYGFGLMYLFEGLGLKIRTVFPFSFVARVKLPHV